MKTTTRNLLELLANTSQECEDSYNIPCELALMRYLTTDCWLLSLC